MEKVMKIKDLGISTARSRITKIPSEISGKSEVLRVTSNNKPVLALLSWELFDSMVETIEILADTELMAMLSKSEKQMTDGETVSWDEAKSILSK